jgi:tryptophanyl-tRNA synthetase
VRHDRDAKPGVSNLIEIYGAAAGKKIPQVEAEFAGQQYGAFKAAVADAVVEMLRPVRERYAELEADPDAVDRALARGAAKAEVLAAATMTRVRAATGQLPRRD